MKDGMKEFQAYDYNAATKWEMSVTAPQLTKYPKANQGELIGAAD